MRLVMLPDWSGAFLRHAWGRSSDGQDWVQTDKLESIHAPYTGMSESPTHLSAWCSCHPQFICRRYHRYSRCRSSATDLSPVLYLSIPKTESRTAGLQPDRQVPEPERDRGDRNTNNRRILRSTLYYAAPNAIYEIAETRIFTWSGSDTT